VLIIDSMSGVVAPILGGQRVDGHALMTTAVRLIKDIAQRFHTRWQSSVWATDRLTRSLTLCVLCCLQLTNHTVSANMSGGGGGGGGGAGGGMVGDGTSSLAAFPFSDIKPALGESWTFVADTRLALSHAHASPIAAHAHAHAHAQAQAQPPKVKCVIAKSTRVAAGGSVLLDIDTAGVVQISGWQWLSLVLSCSLRFFSSLRVLLFNKNNKNNKNKNKTEMKSSKRAFSQKQRRISKNGR
jgi:hypothetical protein